MSLVSVGDHLWAWQEQDGPDSWGTIAALATPGHAAPMPLVTRSREIALAMSDIALAHGDASGKRVRLAHFALQGLEAGG